MASDGHGGSPGYGHGGDNGDGGYLPKVRLKVPESAFEAQDLSSWVHLATGLLNQFYANTMRRANIIGAEWRIIRGVEGEAVMLPDGSVGHLGPPMFPKQSLGHPSPFAASSSAALGHLGPLQLWAHFSIIPQPNPPLPCMETPRLPASESTSTVHGNAASEGVAKAPPETPLTARDVRRRAKNIADGNANNAIHGADDGKGGANDGKVVGKGTGKRGKGNDSAVTKKHRTNNEP